MDSEINDYGIPFLLIILYVVFLHLYVRAIILLEKLLKKTFCTSQLSYNVQQLTHIPPQVSFVILKSNGKVVITPVNILPNAVPFVMKSLPNNKVPSN